jgi:hypothetical protein
MQKSSAVDSALDTSIGLTEWFIQNQPTAFSFSERGRIAGVFFALTMEHREAAMLLAQKGARSSCFALARAVFEAYMRGTWVVYSATDDELIRFMQGKYDPKLDTMVKKLGQLAEFRGGVFDKIRSSGWEPLCDYAHGGIRQVSRWITDDGIEPRHSDDEVLEVLYFMNLYGLLAGLGVAGLAGQDGKIYLEKADELKTLQATRSPVTELQR